MALLVVSYGALPLCSLVEEIETYKPMLATCSTYVCTYTDSITYNCNLTVAVFSVVTSVMSCRGVLLYVLTGRKCVLADKYVYGHK